MVTRELKSVVICEMPTAFQIYIHASEKCSRNNIAGHYISHFSMRQYLVYIW